MKPIDENRFYKVTLVSVECKDWDKYFKKCLQLSFYVPELGKPATRTISVPKSFNPSRSKFTRIFGSILKKQYPESLLAQPEMLAHALDADLSRHSYLAHLRSSKDGRFIDVEAIEPLGDG